MEKATLRKFTFDVDLRQSIFAFINSEIRSSFYQMQEDAGLDKDTEYTFQDKQRVTYKRDFELLIGSDVS